MSTIVRVLTVCCTAVALSATQLTAQSELSSQCEAANAPDSTRRYCNLVAEAIGIAQPRVGLALAGGNPVPGASSTLGMRLGAIPRISVAGRVTGVLLELPPIERMNSNDEIKALVPSLNVDAT